MKMGPQKKLKVFSINYVSESDNTTYIGTFSCRRLSVRDLAELAVRKSKLNGGMYYDEANPGKGVDQATDNLNHMLAHLELALTGEKPSWWNLAEINDLGLIAEIFSEVANFENSFRIRNQPSEDQGGSQEAPSQTHSRGTPTKVVGQEIPAALDP